MKQLCTIFCFEFKTYARSKVYMILTAILILIAGGVLSWPRISDAMGPSVNTQAPEMETVAVSDKSGGSSQALAALLGSAISDKQFQAVDDSADTIKSAVESGKYSSAIVLNSNLDYTYIVKDIGLYDTTSTQAGEILLAKYRSEKLQQLGVSGADTQALLSAQVKSDVVQTANGKDQMNNFFYTYILMFALYMAILMYGQFVASSVATEKSTRAMELLITSTRPRNLMFGKVLGAGLAGLTQIALIFGSGFLFYNLNQKYYADNQIVQSIFNMPLSILLYVLLFFFLGFFIYAFLYGALGSLVSRMEQLSQTIAPVNFLFIIAFMIVMINMGSGSVDNPVMVVCSYIPFTSPMAMFVRIAMGNVANWEIAVSVAILVVSVIGIGFLAASIYRIGVLLYGKAPKPREIVKMLKSSR